MLTARRRAHRHGRPTAAVALAALLLAACGSPPPPAPPAEPVRVVTAPAPAPRGGEVIARNERLAIYRAGPSEGWAEIATRFYADAAQAWRIAAENPGLAQPQVGRPLVVPLQPVNPPGVGADRFQVVTILCYHRFGLPATKMSIPPASFAAQLQWLAANDYQVIRLADLRGFLEGRRALPPRAVVITIDDGYESVYRHAYPLLKKHGFPATLFAYTDFVGVGDGLSWAQLQELEQSGLIDVQSHSKSHRNLIERQKDETEVRYRANIDAEMRVPRDLISRRLGGEVRHIAYPYGDANALVLDSAARHGFELGATVVPGANAFFAQPLLLRRTMIFGDMDLEAFKARVLTSRPYQPLLPWPAP